MRRRIGFLAPSIVVMATALFLAGCSGASNSTTAPEKPVGPTVTVGSTEASGEGPTLSDFVPWSAAFGDEADAEQWYLEQERSVQDSIARCMAEQGFEYIPYMPNQDRGGFAGPDSAEELAERYGFGIATQILEESQIEEEDEATAKAVEKSKDPNFAIVEAMTPEERQEYDTALYGTGPSPGDPISDEGNDPTNPPSETSGSDSTIAPSGCLPIAQEEFYNDAAGRAFDAKFGEAFNDLRGIVESDPRITALKDDWSSCMAAAGYDFTSESDVRTFLFRRLEDVGAITNLEVDSSGEVSLYFPVDFEPGDPIEAAVKKIASEEIALAKLSLVCFGNYDEVYEMVYQEAEQRFIAEHLAELEQFRRDHS
ncbi:MAG: hypothetical protein DWP92_01070 [Armatimonadetes bacterium]|nr:MAG: hypothetical protein DWP92_01070 [Armatimonadota bacterium]